MNEDEINQVVINTWKYMTGSRVLTLGQAHEIVVRLLLASCLKLAGGDRLKAAALAKEAIGDLIMAIVDPKTVLTGSTEGHHEIETQTPPTRLRRRKPVRTRH